MPSFYPQNTLMSTFLLSYFPTFSCFNYFVGWMAEVINTLLHDPGC